MNLRRALLRLWLVISGFWIGGVLLGVVLLDRPGMGDFPYLIHNNAVLVWAIALVPPLVVRIILALLGWVITGLFEPRSAQGSVRARHGAGGNA